MRRRLASFIIGLVVAAVLWAWLATPYNHVLAFATEPLLRIDRRYADADLTPRDHIIRVESAHGSFPPIDMPAEQLTYNFIFLVALFASNPRPFRDRNAAAFAISFLIVAAFQVLGTFASIESTFAARSGRWSELQYGDFAANAWLLTELFYRLVGMFGIVFACWYASTRESKETRIV